MWLFSAVVVFILAIRYYFRRKYKYWSDRGIPSPKTNFIFGHFQIGSKKDKKIPQYVQLDNFYKEFKGKADFAGLYFFATPGALLLNLDFIKRVLIKDFDHFVDRGSYFNERDDPLSANLLSLPDKKWRKLRTKITPTFSGAKMKWMFPIIVEITKTFQDAVEKIIDDNPEGFEIKDIMNRFTIDVIGNCAFGIECNSFSDPQNDFRNTLKQIPFRSFSERIKVTFARIFPNLGRFLRIAKTNPKVSAFILKVIKENVEFREQNRVQRNDFLNLLIELKNNPKDPEDHLTLNEIAAQSFIFLLGGYDTSATTMLFCLYEMAMNPIIQDKVRQNIRESLDKHKNQMTYDCLGEMDYLEKVINETLRKYPLSPVLNRYVTKDYKIENTKVTLKKGMLLLIPVYSIHRDPEFYPDPETFNPDRFDKENSMHPCSFIPFGLGPRNCIGLRFGMMQTKAGLAALLIKFRFQRTDRTPSKLEIDPESMVFSPVGGVFLKVEKL